MKTSSRIPKLTETSFDGALLWFSQLQCEGLLFHPEDDPASIRQRSDEEPLFSGAEVSELRFVIGELENAIGHDAMIEAAYPFFMKAVGSQLDA